MERRHLTKPSALVALMVLAGMVAALLPAVLPTRARAAVACPATETGADTDADGFTDFQECNGITLADGLVRVPPCPSPSPLGCLDPSTKDLFVILAPATTGSLLPVGFNPFVNPLTVYGVTTKGLSTLGITVHQITPAQANPDRTVIFGGGGQKAVKLAESLDTSGSVLGFCQWGTPNQLDGCTVYTQRIISFISSTCGTNPVVTPGGLASTASEAFLAYATHVSLHEAGHTTGGMTGTYNSSYGGNHYQAANTPGTGGKGTRMEQYVTYSTKGGSCKFYIPTDFDASLDPPTVTLR